MDKMAFVSFVSLTLVIIVVLIINLIRGKITSSDIFGYGFVIVILTLMTLWFYISYKKGPLTYLINDYDMKYNGYIDDKYEYIKDNIKATYVNDKFNSTLYIKEKMSNNLDTKFHFSMLMKDYPFDKKVLNLIFEYITNNLDLSKEIIFYGNHNHITIGYDRDNEIIYYEIIKERYKYSSGSGEDKKVEKNPNYNKYYDYQVIVPKYDEFDMNFYDRIATIIVGENVEPKVEGNNLIYSKK